MEILGLFVPFVAAGGWLWWIHHTDRFDKEPWRLVLKTFGFGAAAGLAGLIGLVAVALLLPEELGFGTAMVLMVPVHLIAMLLVIRLGPYRKPDWNDPFDGIVYGGATGIGYGLSYTLFALLDSPVLGFRSAVFSIPTYMLAGLIIGHYMSQLRFGPREKRFRFWFRSLFIAGIYLGGIELFQALGGEVMGRENILASVVVFGANTVGWVMALWAMDSKHRASQHNPVNHRLPLTEVGCHACSAPLPAAAAFCSQCGSAVTEAKEVQA